jgi:hypothetical protein
VTTYEIHKNCNERTRESWKTGRIYTTNRPFWCVVIDGDWNGDEFDTKREAVEFVERHKANHAND